MNFSFYINKIITEEELEFILDLITEIIQTHIYLWIFITDDACYQLTSIVRGMENNCAKNQLNQDQIQILINQDVYKSLGLNVNSVFGGKCKIRSDFLEEESFNKKYLDLSSDLKDRHLKL